MTAPLRVLHVMTAIDRGGAENHLVELVRHQCASGMQVTVAYLRGHGYWAAPMREMGATVHDLRLRFYGDLRPLSHLRRILAKAVFDLVHAHLPPAEVYVRLALLGGSARDLPLVISKHNDCPFHTIPGERALGRWVARRASAVIAISRAVREYMIGPALGLPPEQVQTIYYGIDVQPFANVTPESVAALRQEWGANPETLLIGFAGRLVAQKSIDTLIRAFALFLKNDRSRDTKLVILGCGPLESALRECAAQAGVADRMIWAGFREDVPRVLHAFDIFAITSAHEGFGLVLVEAMAAARPVVATRAGAIPEVVVDGETGFLADPGNTRQIADAFSVLTDSALRRQLGAAGHHRARSEFTLEKMWRQTDELYAHCLDLIPATGSEESTIITAPLA
jgi:glycosyltransferase involved in cell wall biosynthesis